MKEIIPAKKSLGQCFLVEKSHAREIAASLGVTTGSTVIEIGPGRGILTEFLLETPAQVIAVEIDQRLIDPLGKKFGNSPNFRLLHQDFLETDFEMIRAPGDTIVVGNLPYHLVGQVLGKLIAQVRRARSQPAQLWIDRAVLMMQREVAERVSAVPGSRTWGKLSVFAQLEATAHLLFVVPAKAFRPVPKVDGGVVRLDFWRLPPVYPKDLLVFERIVTFCFQQRRKMLKSTLSQIAGVHPFWQTAPLDFTRRPETLSPAEWVLLADIVADAQARRGRKTDG